MPVATSHELTFGPAADRARRLFEIPVLVAALLVVPVIVIEERSLSASWQTTAAVANWVIWAVFLAEFLVVVSLANARSRYVTRAWLDLFIIVVSFPLLASGLAATRLLRLFRLTRVLRLLRLVRLAAVITRGAAATGAVFRKRGLGYVLALILLLAFGIGGVFAMVEGSSVADGLWWAIVTVTTVGYGDMFPVTTGGRIAAAILMLLGIGLIAVLTASVAAHFVGQEEKVSLHDEVSLINRRLDEIERLLKAATGAESDPYPTSAGDESAV